MNVSIYGEFDSEGRYIENIDSDSRLLDAAETLVTLQTSDLVSGSGSNNPLFGSNIAHNSQGDDRQFAALSRGQEQGESGVSGGGGGRGRGKRGPSKRGRKKGAEGRGNGANVMNNGSIAPTVPGNGIFSFFLLVTLVLLSSFQGFH